MDLSDKKNIGKTITYQIGRRKGMIQLDAHGQVTRQAERNLDYSTNGWIRWIMNLEKFIWNRRPFLPERILYSLFLLSPLICMLAVAAFVYLIWMAP